MTPPPPPPPPDSPPSKAVSISTEEPETIEIPESQRRPSHSLRKTLSTKRLHGRLPVSPHLAASVVTRDVIPRVSLSSEQQQLQQQQQQQQQSIEPGHHHHHHYSGGLDKLSTQIHDWVTKERTKRANRRARRRSRRENKHPASSASPEHSSEDESLNTLEAIITAALASRPSMPRKKSSQRRRSLAASIASDTEYASDGEAIVPTCEVWLKTPEESSWDVFREEVLKLTHTLKCKGWRRVALDRSKELGVERISGALTNAVYMISPPSKVPDSVPSTAASSTTSLPLTGKPPPSRLLLRIYGPQVSHLIDRATELSILRRLARNNIGPRLLGTFENGRFEQFFTARTLTKADIRIPATSRHIAKRLKELHSGIELLDNERTQGPIVWANWTKWAPRAASVLSSVSTANNNWWPAFESAVSVYRAWLAPRTDALIFAHNDTQYGNILRLQASTKSPLLMPENEHRQLVVIDFEYASANTVGFEVANHFCEWMADYHCDTPHVMHRARYPTEVEQRNFLGAYVEHRLHSGVSSSLSGGRNTVVGFSLDARVPQNGTEKDEKVEKEIDKLMEEVRVWRAAAHVMWCAWGVVQAKTEDVGGEGEEGGDEEEEFDYLAYAKQRAALFWKDIVELGIVGEEEAGEAMRGW